MTLLALLLTGCASTPAPTPAHSPAHQPHPRAPAAPTAEPAPAPAAPGGYYQDDGPGESPPPNLMDTPDAEVRAEPYARYANRPYKVFGKLYTPMLDERPFVQHGQGSWYGKKFHGQKTSSGEIYDMYKMTAAHPTLPIPSYARVTSVESGKAVVVRINDRGPFHAGRIIDLSYTAAVKLGLLARGSQQVVLERVLANAAPAEHALAGPEQGFYLQMGAFSRADKANAMCERMSNQGWSEAALDVVRSDGLHKVMAGPFATRELAQEAARSVPSGLGLKPMVVKR
ncbi:MAG: septal ring lytic transglycosylase RlpA family protein [Pseudomonadota bacterium]